MIPLARFVRSTPFFVVAHRGASGMAPENTLAALRMAVEGGARMIELDVQTTSDHELVVFHDSILGRTTNGHGYVRRTPLADLRKLDAGSWFSPLFMGERVPLLSEALAALEGRAYLNIELKPMQDDDPSTIQDIRDLVALVHHVGIGQFMAFASFDHRTLALVKSIDTTLHTVAINVPGDKRMPSEVVRACGADAYGCSLQELTHARANDARAHGLPVGVYTVNTEEDLRKALSYGIQAVVSNYPERITAAYHRLTFHG